MNNILRSVGLTLAISTIVSFALLIANVCFWTSFIVATISQFIIFFIVGRVIEFINEIKLKEIDIRGAFEADDEVGYVFKSIKEVSEDLTKTIQNLYNERNEN